MPLFPLSLSVVDPALTGKSHRTIVFDPPLVAQANGSERGAVASVSPGATGAGAPADSGEPPAHDRGCTVGSSHVLRFAFRLRSSTMSTSTYTRKSTTRQGLSNGLIRTGPRVKRSNTKRLYPQAAAAVQRPKWSSSSGSESSTRGVKRPPAGASPAQAPK